MKTWRRLLPYLHIYVDIGVLRIRTSLLYRNLNATQFEYVSLDIEVLRHRLASFCLYRKL